MYRRVVLCLGGRGRTAGALTASRHTDHILKCFSLGNVHCSEKKPPENVIGTPPAEEKKPPENHVCSNPPAEGAKDILHKEASSKLSPLDNLRSTISGMKVQVEARSKVVFWETKRKKRQQKGSENREPLESVSKMFQVASEGNRPKEEKAVDPKMVAAVSAVASTFPDEKKKVESELLRQLRINKQMAETRRKEVNIRNVISGMEVKIPYKSLSKTREEGDRERGFLKEHVKSPPRLSTGKRLNIFPAPPVSEETTITGSSPTLWDIELAKEIATAAEQPPRNGFEEMIQWTNEGIMWTFPINNEAGLDEEQNVEFHEHIFLDKYLEDFPMQGPIRHFMELVVCGLSKNPYLTVQQKKEHIDWFRDYFNQKEDVLRECDLQLN